MDANQECGHKQETRPPAPTLSQPYTDAWANKKCKRCKSESLDYGYAQTADVDDEDWGPVQNK